MLKRIVFMLVFLLLPAWSFSSADAVEPLKQGDELYASGEIKSALIYYEKAVKQNPDSSQNWFKLARTQMLDQQNLASVDSFKKSITLDNTNALAFVGMAIAYLHLGKYNHAKAALEEAARIDPARQAEVDKVLLQINHRLNTMESSSVKAGYPAH
jgi:tetratricopeptide (TPR) repeat protein